MHDSHTFQNYFPAEKERLTAIIVCTGPGNIGNPFKKYHNIAASDRGREHFINFAKKFPGISHINFYRKRKAGQVKGELIGQWKPDEILKKVCKHINSGFVGIVGEIYCDDCKKWIT